MTSSIPHDEAWRDAAAPAAPRSLPVRLLSGGRSFIELVRVFLTEHRRAQAASELYEQLRHYSVEDLAKAGIRREDLATEIRTRLYADTKRS